MSGFMKISSGSEGETIDWAVTRMLVMRHRVIHRNVIEVLRSAICQHPECYGILAENLETHDKIAEMHRSCAYALIIRI